MLREIGGEMITIDDQIRRRAEKVIESVRAELSGGYLAAFVAGSRVRGGYDGNADIDVHVVHDRGWWQACSFVDDGFRFDVLVGSIELYSAQLDMRKSTTARAILEAAIIDDPGRIMATLREQAGRVFALPRRFAPPGLESMARHRPCSLLDDARDLFEDGDITGMRYLISVVADLAIAQLLKRSAGLMGAKERIRRLQSDHPELYAMFSQLTRVATPQKELDVAQCFVEAAYADVGGIASDFQTDRIPWQVALKFLGS